jgi:hypothetical protein
MAVDPLAQFSAKSATRILEPMDRISEVLFGLIMALMLFVCGYAFGRCAGFRPWATGLSMVAIGAALVGVAIALGG